MDSNISVVDESALDLVNKIINNLDDKAMSELLGGYSHDVDQIFDELYHESKHVLGMYHESLEDKSNFKDLTFLSEAVEETYRINSFNYFITSCLPEFEMNWHHLEWGNMVQMYQNLCIIAARGHGKCLKKGTKVVMYNGSLKMVEDVVEGDLLMGPDSKPRKVLSKVSGNDTLYRVKQTRGDDYVVNSNHILSLYYRNRYSGNNELIDIPIEDYLKLSKYNRYNKRKGYKVSTKFSKRKVLIDPYYLGLWLADGNKHNTAITSIDKEIIDYLKDFSKDNGLRFKIRDNKLITLSVKQGMKNHLKDDLENLGVLNNKHIPNNYIFNSKEVRLQLLAGFIDGDGYVVKNKEILISQKDKNLIFQLKRLCDSLGYYTSIRRANKYVKFLKSYYESWELKISGDIHEIPCKLPRKRIIKNSLNKKSYKKPDQVNNYDITVLSSLDIEEDGFGEYHGFIIDGDQRFLLEDNTVTHNSYFFSRAYPLWKLYRYRKQSDLIHVPSDQTMREGMIITNEISLARLLLEGVKEEIDANDILKEKLMPSDRGQGNWRGEFIKCKNGAGLYVKSYNSKMRGRHPHWIVVDDFLTDQAMYSEEMRERFHNIFYAVVMNMIEPGGQVINVGTPYSDLDLFNKDLKNDPDFKVFEYPGIFPDGSLLWENRFTLDTLLKKRESQGSIIFSREVLCQPVTSESTIFPYEMVSKCFTDDFHLVNNYYSAPTKFKRIVMGCDFARSANVGADYSVFITIGIDSRDRYWILNVYREKGRTLHQQIAALKSLYQNFRHDVIIMENNQMQQLFVDDAKIQGLPVEAHTTGKNKYDLQEGLPSLAILFEQKKFRMPIADQRSIDVTEMLAMELSSIAWTDKGLQGVGAHDDMVMGLLMSVIAARKGTGFSYGFV